ncbi:addiction module protein [Prosthecobacter vanneervenii]|uniref:Putative addiction module component (TIGR02574 family) n=1 Tax=Prosthecobacter vanneervenii TaxID=48466 RepID=A0A7W7Y7Y1_9BACT|nr:addiction module protein [Prosthecobacter vanneervenii]MBB5031077.1 putative addiction module component (TIGR02574 family) [Prosthecobacter vanneervenii]
MTATFNAVLEQALQLPAGERSRIAARLIESVDDADDVEMSPAWSAEIENRMESIRQGTATLVAHDEVMAGVRRKLAAQSVAKQA